MNAAGTDARPALVMLHGFALDARMWRRQVSALAADHRILLVDLPGFGPQAKDPSDAAPAREVTRAMDVAALPRAHVVASGLGAAVAVDLALAYPGRVASLVLATPMFPGTPATADSWDHAASLALEGDPMTAAEVWLDDPTFETVRRDEDLFDEVRQIVLDYGGGHWTGKVTATWLEADPAARLDELAVPALIVSGAEDEPASLARAERFAGSIPNARRTVLPDVGAHVPLEAADAFSGLVRSFVARVR